MVFDATIRHARKQAREEGKFLIMVETVRSLMGSLPCDAKKAMDLLNIPISSREKIIAQL